MNQEKLKATQNIKNRLAKNANNIKYVSYTLNGICGVTGTCGLVAALCGQTAHTILLGSISTLAYFGAQDTWLQYRKTQKDIKKLGQKIKKLQKHK